MLRLCREMSFRTLILEAVFMAMPAISPARRIGFHARTPSPVCSRERNKKQETYT